MKRFFRVIAILFGAMVILIVILETGVSILLPKIIKDKLEETVAEASDGKYHLEIGKVTTSLLNRSVGIHHARLQFDSTASVFSSDSFKVKWRGEIELIAVSGIDVISFIRHKDISVQQVILEGSNVEMIRATEEIADEDSDKSAGDSSQNPFVNFHSIKIGSVITRKTSFAIFNAPADTLPSFQTKNIKVNLKAVTVDSSTLYFHHRLFDAKSASAAIRDIQFVTPDSLFVLAIPLAEFSYHDYSIHIDSLHFSPRCSRKEFLKKIPFEKDYLEIFIRRIDLKNANIKGLLEKKECVASRMIIDSMMVEAYRDKNLPDNKKVKPMPLDLLHKVPFLVSLDSVSLNGMNVLYTERTCDANSAGKVWFNDINATLTHVTNDSILHRHDTLSVRASGLLMGEGKTEINFHFPLFSISQSFFGNGEIGIMPMKALNPMLEKNAFVSVKAGMIKKVEFTMHADALQSRGELWLMYNDLEIAKLNSNDLDDSAFPEKVISVIANLLIRKNNPEPKSGTKQSSMYWRRDPSRSIFNYVWKTILSGVKDTFGVPSGKNTSIGTTTCP